MEPPTISLRECMRGFGADPSQGVRVVMQSAHQTSVRALCKSRALRLRIMAWNIAEGDLTSDLEPNGVLLPQIAQQIRAKNPDLVLLNEVRRRDRTGSDNQVEELARMTGLQYYHWARAADSGLAGYKVVAALSRYPLTDPRALFCGVMGGEPDDCATLGATWWVRNDIYISVYSTRFPPIGHLDPDQVAGNKEGLRQATEYFQGIGRYPVIFGGDLNAPESHEEVNVDNIEEFNHFVQNSGLTKAYPELQPGACDPENVVDHIFYRGPFRVAHSERGCPWPATAPLSDHPWVFVELEDTQPPECGKLRSQKTQLNERVRLLYEQKNGLNPRDPIDRDRIDAINAQISEVNGQITQLRQQQTAIGCWF